MNIRSAFLALAALCLFCISYGLMNQYLLVHSILYRAAANDFNTAIWSGIGLSIQALILLVLTVKLRARYFYILCGIIAISVLANITYGQILSNLLDAGKINWLLAEFRQAGNAAGEFFAPFTIALVKLAAALVCLIFARRLMHKSGLAWLGGAEGGTSRRTPFLIALFIVPSLIFGWLGLYPLAAERNLYSYLYDIATAAPLPKKGPVDIAQNTGENSAADIRKVIWLVDESISHSIYETTILPSITQHNGVDFGKAASLSNCSGPANFALRNGVDVDGVTDQTDLRIMPSIWAYAHSAGFNTVLIDGQVSGPPQNIILDTERALIGEYLAVADGLETDQNIAAMLNTAMKTDGKIFAYAVLKGVHFQYRDHYPEGALADDAPVEEQYETAVRYSKQGFFDALLDGVDRSEVAIFYTSDHGQNIAEGVTPHCTLEPAPIEFEVPLVSFLPAAIAEDYRNAPKGGRSASQIFPTTLGLMGFDVAAAADLYDADLSQPSRQQVWFGRNVIPINAGDAIELHKVGAPKETPPLSD